MANTTWTTSGLVGSLTLSNGNLTVTSSSGNGFVRTPDFLNSGKYYWEVKADAIPSYYFSGCGVCKPSSSFENYFLYVSSNGNIYRYGNTYIGINIGAITTGDYFCFAIDLDNRLFWARKNAGGNWNNSASANPATGLGGISYSGYPEPAYLTPFAQLGQTADKYTLNAGDSAFSGTVPTGYTSGWPTTSDHPALVSSTAAEAWSRSNPTASPATITSALAEAWISTETKNTDANVSATLLEIWTTQNPAVTVTSVSSVMAEVWFVVGSSRPINPAIIYCATEPQDADGDAGSPGTGMTDQLGGAFVPDNPPVDATGDITNDPPIVFQFSNETLACITAPTNSDGHDAGSTGTGITSLLVDTITPDAQPVNATGDIITTNTGVSGQITSIISCTTTATNATGDVGNSGTGVTDQLSDPLTCNVSPTDADGGSGVPPASYSTQIP